MGVDHGDMGWVHGPHVPAIPVCEKADLVIDGVERLQDVPMAVALRVTSTAKGRGLASSSGFGSPSSGGPYISVFGGMSTSPIKGLHLDVVFEVFKVGPEPEIWD